MVYFANKTRNHAKGFRIQKHLLAANESCVPISQNCCATDFRKTMIRFVACQALTAFHHANLERPGAWPHFRRLAAHSPTKHAEYRRASSIAKHHGARAKTARTCDDAARTTRHSPHWASHTSRLPKNPFILRKYVFFLISSPSTEKAHFSALN